MRKPQSSVAETRGPERNSRLEPQNHCSEDGVLPEEQFHQLVRMERKRARRSGKPFLLVHLDVTRHLAQGSEKLRQSMLRTLTHATRGTDILGWSKSERVIGIMFVELGAADLDNSLMATMLLRVSDVLRNFLALEQFRRIDISFQRFPEQEQQLPQLLPQLFSLGRVE